jgi:type III restriction enzyme
VTIDWENVPGMTIDPMRIPPEVEVKGLHPTNSGRLSLSGPGRADQVSLEGFRARNRMQQLEFDVAAALSRRYVEQQRCDVPVETLFPQLAKMVKRYLAEKVEVKPPADLKDLFLAPYYGWLVEALLENIRGDVSEGEAPELPLYEASRGKGSTREVDFWTSREVREVTRSHVNAVVADTKKWEQSAAYYLDTHAAVRSFVKNAGLGFGIPYLHNGEMHDYVPDFLVSLKGEPPAFLIIETKGYDPLKEVKKAAALRWCAAVNADGRHGEWRYELAGDPAEVRRSLDRAGRSAA